MKKIISLLFLYCLSSSVVNAQPSPAVELANSIADKMKDSLQLSQAQREQVYEVNMQLFNQKMQARTVSQNREVVTSELQQIENTRDSLYKPFLTVPQFELYLQKKETLISAN